MIEESVKPLQASLDSHQTTVNFLQKRLTTVESTAGDDFEFLAAAESAIKNPLQIHNRSLENRSQRSVLPVLNVFEGSEDSRKLMSKLLMQIMGHEVFFPALPELERAHRSPTLRADAGQRKYPRAVLACFSRFQQKEALYQRNVPLLPDLPGSSAHLRQRSDVHIRLAQ